MTHFVVWGVWNHGEMADRDVIKAMDAESELAAAQWANSAVLGELTKGSPNAQRQMLDATPDRAYVVSVTDEGTQVGYTVRREDLEQ